MSKKIRIVKKYKSWSERNGITEADVVTIQGGPEECAAFVTKINASNAIDYEIIDYEPALISHMKGPEIIENLTGGGVGRIIRP